MITDNHKKEYITAYSHETLANKIGISLATLDRHAEENGWKEEYKLYWEDKSIEILKQEVLSGNVAAVKEMLKLVGLKRPVGRPPKAEVERRINIERKIQEEYAQDVLRLEQSRKKS